MKKVINEIINIIIGIVIGSFSLAISIIIQMWIKTGVNKSNFAEIIQYLNSNNMVIWFAVLGGFYGLFGTTILISSRKQYLFAANDDYVYYLSMVGLKIGFTFGIFSCFTFGLFSWIDKYFGNFNVLFQIILFSCIGLFLGFVISFIKNKIGLSFYPK